jgi:hypothetical protein
MLLSLQEEKMKISIEDTLCANGLFKSFFIFLKSR